MEHLTKKALATAAVVGTMQSGGYWDDIGLDVIGDGIGMAFDFIFSR
jgi:hypothetical protein